MRGLPFLGVARPTCYSCFRPRGHCTCQLIIPFEAHVNILLLQHPNERHKYYGTAKLVRSAIRNSKLLRGVVFEDGEIESAIENQTAYLLYPGRHSFDCTTVSLSKEHTIIAIDGTWSEAGKIYYRNPVLKTLPCLSFATPIQSNYKIRKQPKEHYLSTLESIGHLLKLSAEGMGLHSHICNYERLFEGFDKMVAQQYSYFPRMQTAK